MCLIITFIMLFLAIQNLWLGHILAGAIQLIIALLFLGLLLRNIAMTRCERDGKCDSFCMLPDWVLKIFRK